MKVMGSDHYRPSMVLEQSFNNEINMSHDHDNLVRLKGFWPDLHALVHERMLGGSLESVLFGTTDQPTTANRKRFGLSRRVYWLFNVACGVAFLHTGFT